MMRRRFAFLSTFRSSSGKQRTVGLLSARSRADARTSALRLRSPAFAD